MSERFVVASVKQSGSKTNEYRTLSTFINIWSHTKPQNHLFPVYAGENIGYLMKFLTNGLRIGLGSIALVVAACEDAPRTDVTYKLDDVWSFARGAMNSGPLPVVIRGIPYDNAATLNTAVIDAMTQAITWSADPRFEAADAGSGSGSSFRVVFTLNGGALGGRDQCQGKSGGGGPLPEGQVRVTATFCDGEDVLSNVRGKITRTDGVDDPRFSRLVRQVTRDMFIESQDN